MNDHTEKRILAEGKYLRLVHRDGWDYVERPACTGIAVIVAVTERREILLVEQYRKPLEANVIEFPAGLVGDTPGHENESIEHAALRELYEETGYEAASLSFLFDGPPSAGLSTEIVTFFLAHDIKKTGPGDGDGFERITLHTVLLDGIEEWLANKKSEGIFIDPKIYSGLYFVR
jgi:ADP-ribose pyrophosphatase